MKKKNQFILQQSIIISSLTIFFTIIVFFIKNYYFSPSISIQEIEEKYLEPTIDQKHIEDHLDKHENEELLLNESDLTHWDISELIQQHYSSAAPFVFKFFPEEFKSESNNFSLIFSDFLQSDIIKWMIFDLNIDIHQDLLDVRWKMKNRSVKLFWYTEEKQAEYLSVAIHELAHFLDIYFLEKKVFQDISEQFYDISWEETKVIIAGQSQVDFVSWYAMTNKYEDFAESFTYYILHNDDFLNKSRKSDILNAKYDFFHNILLKNNFINTDFSVDNTVKEYYRDITKIDVDVQKLLQYLKNWI